MREEVAWVRQIVERVETALVNVTDPVERRRLTVYRLRTLGYTEWSIAEELHISIATVSRDLDWCFANLPPAYKNAEDFRRVSIVQLEEQYQRVVTPRVVLETTETGETVERLELPSLVAEKVARDIKDTQSKLLGAYKSASVDEGEDTVSFTLTVSKPRFDIEGTATEQESIEEHA